MMKYGIDAIPCVGTVHKSTRPRGTTKGYVSMSSSTTIDTPTRTADRTMTMRYPMLTSVMNATASGVTIATARMREESMDYLRQNSDKFSRLVYAFCNRRDDHGLVGQAVQYRLLLQELGLIGEISSAENVAAPVR